MELQNKFLNQFLEEWHAENGISVHTSGSTGTPKDIILPHSQIVNSALRSNRFFGINKNSRIHSAISFEYIGGKMMIARSLLSGCRLTYGKPAVKISLEDCEYPVTLLSLVPAQMHFVLENLSNFSHVEQFLIGGSAINDKLWDHIVESGVTAWESYGMTETATHIGMRRVAGDSKSRPHFVPLSGVSISESSDGCLLIKDRDVFVATTDLVRIYQDNTFEILGRKDDIINTGGLKILPQDIENVLEPALRNLVSSFYISSVPDEIWTSRLILVAVASVHNLRPKNNEELKANIWEAIDAIPDSVLPRRLHPKEIKLVEALPVTRSGKLNRRFKFE